MVSVNVTVALTRFAFIDCASAIYLHFRDSAEIACFINVKAHTSKFAWYVQCAEISNAHFPERQGGGNLICSVDLFGTGFAKTIVLC